MKPEKDLWVDYFTSSKVIHALIKEDGLDSFDVHIDKVFDTDKEAIDYEEKYLIENNVKNNPLYLNGNIKGAVFPSEENFRKISEFHKGKPKTKEHRKKIAEAITGQKHPWARANLPESVSGENNGMYGKKHSDETKRKMSESSKGMVPWNKGKKGVQEAWNKGKTGTYKRTQEANLAAAEKNRGKKRPTRECPHCNQHISVNTYPRWHGDNCKANTYT